MFLPKFLGGVKAFRKNCLGGGSPYFVFYCIFINKFFENLPGGVLFHPPSPPSPPPLCASMTITVKIEKCCNSSKHCNISETDICHLRYRIIKINADSDQVSSFYL
jgi:hypothetical protein